MITPEQIAKFKDRIIPLLDESKGPGSHPHAGRKGVRGGSAPKGTSYPVMRQHRAELNADGPGTKAGQQLSMYQTKDEHDAAIKKLLAAQGKVRKQRKLRIHDPYRPDTPEATQKYLQTPGIENRVSKRHLAKLRKYAKQGQ